MAQLLSTERIKEIYQDIIGLLIGDGSKEGACGINIVDQFIPVSEEHFSVPRKINAAFLIVLAGENHPKFVEAKEYFEEMENDPLWSKRVSFYKGGLERMLNEFNGFCLKESFGWEKVQQLREAIKGNKKKPPLSGELQDKLWGVFHPEASGILNNEASQRVNLSEKRKVNITNLNSKPIRNVAEELLFTANTLVTIPSRHKGIHALPIDQGLINRLQMICREKQKFWDGHPMKIGVEEGKNEILYGLGSLADTLRFEKKIGNIDQDAELSCVLSASLTHEGLQGIIREYIEGEIKKVHNLSGLQIFLFTEADTNRLVREVLLPAACKYFKDRDKPAVLLKEIIGVDGRYGRHYSFLKAIAAFWHVFIDRRKRATFKIDLDQAFPQEKLLQETDNTAFQHLMSPLWGAEGLDSEGNPVFLGMIAGSLVNKEDAESSLFTPDVTYPSPPFTGEEALFCSRIPQALSTTAEMMTHYVDGEIDGKKSCIQRIHITGGMNGILIDALRKYRPFTPTFVGRAEDQAYLLSVLFPANKGPALRYVHKDGFFMRHDKEAIADEETKAVAHIGKLVGDFERVILFSHYARELPWGEEKIKGLVDPFTGSFISHLPINLAYLRLALKAATFFATGNEEDGYKGLELLDLGSKRLSATIELVSKERGLKEIIERERNAWDLYYDILDKMEEDLNKRDPFAAELMEKAKIIVKHTMIDIKGSSQSFAP